jgi:hypothetical protein
MVISCYSFAMREEFGLRVRERWLLVPRELWIGWRLKSIVLSMPLSVQAVKVDFTKPDPGSRHVEDLRRKMQWGRAI